MKKSQIIVVAVALVLVVVLYNFGSIVKPKKEAAPEAATTQTDDHEHTPMVSPMAKIAPAEIGPLVASFKKKLNPSLVNKVEDLEKGLEAASGDAAKAVALDNIGRFWYEQKNRLLAAYYVGQSGFLDNSEKKLTFASHLMSEDIETQEDPAVRKLMFEVANKCYDKLLTLQPQNEDVRIDQALMIINGSGEVMTGIGTLLDIVDKNPKNLRAQSVLVNMAIQSGQYDKAIERANVILEQDPERLEAYLMKSDAYARAGKKDEAIATLQTAKKVMNNPDFDKDVDKFIEENLR